MGAFRILLCVYAALVFTVCKDTHALKWTPPRYNKTVWTAFRSKELLTPYKNLTSDPYKMSHFNTTRSRVCGVEYSDGSRKSYNLRTFPDVNSVQKAGAFLTHLGGCSLCSTLQDLSVYMEHFNLTAPVRKCGIKGFVSKKKNMECLLQLGFTYPCATIWLDNSQNTKQKCLVPCLKDWNKPYNLPNGTLNKCLECDEEKSGPIFKKVAARTRRDSGLESAIERPPSSIAHILHYYY